MHGRQYQKSYKARKRIRRWGYTKVRPTSDWVTEKIGKGSHPETQEDFLRKLGLYQSGEIIVPDTKTRGGNIQDRKVRLGLQENKVLLFGKQCWRFHTSTQG